MPSPLHINAMAMAAKWTTICLMTTPTRFVRYLILRPTPSRHSANGNLPLSPSNACQRGRDIAMDFHSCISEGVDFFLTRVPSYSNCLIVVWIAVGIVATALLATYIFYPAYASTGGGLGCTATVLVGSVKQNQQGKIQFRFDIVLHNECQFSNTFLSIEKRNSHSM